MSPVIFRTLMPLFFQRLRRAEVKKFFSIMITNYLVVECIKKSLGNKMLMILNILIR
jgi:hypothetical protein